MTKEDVKSGLEVIHLKTKQHYIVWGWVNHTEDKSNLIVYHRKGDAEIFYARPVALFIDGRFEIVK